jgi:hypothetical protein
MTSARIRIRWPTPGQSAARRAIVSPTDSALVEGRGQRWASLSAAKPAIRVPGCRA